MLLLLSSNRGDADSDRFFVAENAGDLPVLGYLPFSMDAISADMRGQAVYDAAPELVAAAREIVQALGHQT